MSPLPQALPTTRPRLGTGGSGGTFWPEARRTSYRGCAARDLRSPRWVKAHKKTQIEGHPSLGGQGLESATWEGTSSLLSVF